ncbi:MAG TPA: carboxypeptidase regulatory-like domain-containing protein [Candidatus Acidoferrales bacterium]|nr:carboxypeptidase regulatory-like domain-containing protein [Candidatus Acidoferrales bacterium]
MLKQLAGIVRAAIFVAAILLSGVTPGFSQMNTGEIDGIVRDPTTDVVPNAAIVAVESGTQLKYTTKTNAAGEYLLAQLPVGKYTVTVRAEGFKQIVQPSVELHAGDHLRLPFTLELGEQSESLTVSVAAGLLQVESAAIQDTIQQQQVIDLPLKGRDFIDLVGLAPGVTIPPAGTRGSALQQTGTSYGILGQRSGHNLYLVDGVSVTDEAFNNLVLSPSVDDVEEVNINQTSYDAEFGGKSGGVINVITKSGNNHFHGSAFEFVRNDIFDAKNFFVSPALPKPPFQQNQFGGSIGGPIQKDKSFFFADYEGERIRQSQTQLFDVPTALERTGNFTGSGITVNNPSTRAPFANDTIPTIDPVAAAILAKIPLPTPGLTGSNNLNQTALSTTDVNQYNARIDHTFSASDSFFVRASVFDANGFLPFGSSALNEALFPAFGYDLRTHTDNLSATWNHVFSTSWLNELRFGWMWVGGGETSPNAGNNFAGQTGLEGVSSNPLDTGFPDVAITGFSSLGESTQYVSRKDNDFEIYDNVIWHHGTHTVKFGGYVFHLDFDPVNAQNARGTFAFTGKYTGNALGDFLLGTPNQGTVGAQGRGNLLGRTNWAQFYMEDGWQITASLKLDIGVRYEYNQNVTDANNNMAIVNNLVPGGEFVIASNRQGQISPAASALLADIPIPYITSAQAGWNNSLLQGRPLRLAPRIGLAWALPDHKTVIRSGFGIYTNQAAYNIIQNAALNLPFYFAKTVTNTATCAAGAMCNTENILAAPANGSVSANNINHDFKIEYNNVWNLSVERALSSTTSFQAQYIGSYTVHADNETYQNLFPDDGLNPASGLHFRPIPQMSGFPSVTWDGWEKYNALALTFTQRVWRGLIVNSTYTWSKALDDASNPGADNAGPNFPQDPANLAAEKGLSDFDHRHRFVTNFLYQIPFLRNSQGWIHTAFSGWQVGGIWTLQSGAPFTVNLSTDVANNGEPLSAPSQRPNLTCNPNSGPKTPAEWFNTACFSLPAPITYGNAGRDIVTGPGLDDFDATFQNEFPVREDIKLQFRLDIFDFLNHPNFNAPVGAGRMFSASSSFGSITSAQDPRDMQFSMRLVF